MVTMNLSPPLEAQAISTALTQCILQKIQEEGPISFATYMEMALYHPWYGYYQNGTQKLNEGGDFTTAPEISPLFGRCLAQKIHPILTALGPRAGILEIGAGSGQLAVDILTALDTLGSLPERYFILELSGVLKKRQHEKIATVLPHCVEKVTWLNALPTHFEGVILANEVVDAFPVHRFSFHQQRYWVHYVTYSEGEGWKEVLRPAPPELVTALIKSDLSFKEGYTSEINLLLPPWIKSLGDCLERGTVICIDYGFSQEEYYHSDRSMGTLMCHFQHHAHTDPYFWPGLQDITAHVNFTALIEAAEEAGFQRTEYTTQAQFLLNNGLIPMAEQAYQEALKEGDRWNLSQAIKKLTFPSEMGELVKVIVLAKRNESR